MDDYANLLDGLLALLEVAWRDVDIVFAKALAEALLAHFQDADAGGFFFTAHDHEALIQRPKPTLDDAMPPGNGIAAGALTTLGHLLGEPRYLDAAATTLQALRGAMEQHPAGHCSLLGAVEANVHPPEQIIVRGPAELLDPWLLAARAGYKPWRSVYGIPYVDAGLVPSYLPRLVSAEKQARVTAFVCTGLSCSAPIDALDEFERAVT